MTLASPPIASPPIASPPIVSPPIASPPVISPAPPNIAPSVRPRTRRRSIHPLEHHAAFRAVISAAPVIADLARTLDEPDLVGRLTLVCADLAHGFAVPSGSRARHDAHRRAWTAVREIDRNIIAARIHRRAPAKLLKRAQRAIDQADVLISSLPGVLLD
jgi:hypothetical protein